MSIGCGGAKLLWAVRMGSLLLMARPDGGVEVGAMEAGAMEAGGNGG